MKQQQSQLISRKETFIPNIYSSRIQFAKYESPEIKQKSPLNLHHIWFCCKYYTLFQKQISPSEIKLKATYHVKKMVATKIALWLISVTNVYESQLCLSDASCCTFVVPSKTGAFHAMFILHTNHFVVNSHKNSSFPYLLFILLCKFKL